MNRYLHTRGALTGWLLGAAAQTVAPSAAGAEPLIEASGQLEEIVVTARKREERLQDVPISISAISGEDLEQANYTELNDVSRMTSNVYFEAADRSKPLIFVRGIGTRGYDAGSDPSVGVFVDGVYQGRFGALDMDLLDIERVEVLKGPQGTLYGRNTIGGALSVVTREPADVFEARAAAGIGESDIANDMSAFLVGSISGPLTDNGLSGGLSVAHRSRDGYQPIAGTDVRGGSEDSWATRGKLMRDFDNGGRLVLSADYTTMEGPPLILVPNEVGAEVEGPGALAPGYEVPPDPKDPYHPSSDVDDATIDKDVYGASARIDWPFGEFDLTSVTAVRGMELDEWDDLDGSSLPFQEYGAEEDSDQVSQELRIARVGDDVNWLAGLYVSRERVDRTELIDFGPASLLQFLVDPASLEWAFGVDLESTSVAAFGQVEWALTSALTATIGARYSEDEKDVKFDTTTTVPGLVLSPFETSLNEHWSSVDPYAALSYHFTPDVMLYGSWSTGYKSGAFQFIAISPDIADEVADPEEVESIEVGVRSTLLDRRLRLNVAVFDMDYQDLQLLRLVPIGGDVNRIVISNAASSAIEGVEVDAELMLTAEWSVNLSYGYLDATFDDYQFTPTQDFSGNRMPRAPEHSYTAALAYSAVTPLGQLDARLAYAWRDEIYFEVDNELIDPESSEDPLGLLDCSVSLSGERWSASFWGRNLTDERYRRQVLNSTGNAQRGIWAEPRSYGLRVGHVLGP